VTRAIVVMGVSGCGKSTLGRALAQSFGWVFIEGDELHPRSNIDKMAAGIPLDDADRAPFLANVAEAMAEALGPGVVAACSALKRAYRDAIRARVGEATFVMPVLDRATLAARMADRDGHFMPTSLLDSQFAALERPGADEQAILVDGLAPLEDQVAHVRAALSTRGTCG